MAKEMHLKFVHSKLTDLYFCSKYPAHISMQFSNFFQQWCFSPFLSIPTPII